MHVRRHQLTGICLDLPLPLQIIVKEKGVFTNVISPSTKAKLRILFEVAPLSLLVSPGPNSAMSALCQSLPEDITPSELQRLLSSRTGCLIADIAWFCWYNMAAMSQHDWFMKLTFFTLYTALTGLGTSSGDDFCIGKQKEILRRAAGWRCLQALSQKHQQPLGIAKADL